MTAHFVRVLFCSVSRSVLTKTQAWTLRGTKLLAWAVSFKKPQILIDYVRC
jgi:hypothetical protein